MALKNEYVAYCKILHTMIKKANKNYKSNTVKTYFEDSKNLWQFVNSKVGKNSTYSKDIVYIICDNYIFSPL